MGCVGSHDGAGGGGVSREGGGVSKGGGRVLEGRGIGSKKGGRGGIERRG